MLLYDEVTTQQSVHYDCSLPLLYQNGYKHGIILNAIQITIKVNLICFTLLFNLHHRITSNIDIITQSNFND